MVAVLEERSSKTALMSLQLGSDADGGASAEQNCPDLFGFRRCEGHRQYRSPDGNQTDFGLSQTPITVANDRAPPGPGAA